MAYSNASYTNKVQPTLRKRIVMALRQNVKAILATSTFFIFVLLLSSDSVYRKSDADFSHLRKKTPPYFQHSFAGAMHPGYFATPVVSSLTHSFPFAAVTDLDQLSKVKDSSKPLFKSILLSGILNYDPARNAYTIANLDDHRQLFSSHNEAGRGAEFSELVIFDHRLLTLDDRTGTIFEILNKNHGAESFVVPRMVITEGKGDTDKGMKWEWATVKDNELYLGSMGKEYTLPDGTIANSNNLWVVIVDPMGRFKRVDWKHKYDFVKKSLLHEAASTGYVWHEAVAWSNHWNRWIFLPRRVSADKYDEVADEQKGSSFIVFVDEKFTSSTVVEAKFKHTDPLRGFASFAFVPGTKDRHILALRSIEEDCVGGDENICKQRSFISVIDIQNGNVLMDEIRLPQDMKFEGVTFVDIHTPEPSS